MDPNQQSLSYAFQREKQGVRHHQQDLTTKSRKCSLQHIDDGAGRGKLQATE
ncbi:hypothetical protein SynPROS71_00039 [Synechococcus sp. PROS-7-1]|nr:hypothetical protein SynPROS71_00039 [Synechococcus sp. PROS-7-1]